MIEAQPLPTKTNSRRKSNQAWKKTIIEITRQEKTSWERRKSVSCLRLDNIQGKTQPIVKLYLTVRKNPERVFPETGKQFCFCTGNIRKN